MVLTEAQAKLFYDLWIPLLDFVNRKYKLCKEFYGMDSPKGVPLDVVRIISGKLWEDTLVIDEYISKNKQLCDEHMGKHPVIFLSLKNVEGLTFETAKYQMIELIGKEATRFCIQYMKIRHKKKSIN